MSSKILLLILSLMIYPTVGLAYDNEQVHPAINENAAYQSQKFIEWLNKFGFDDPVDILSKEVAGHSIKRWLRQGGTDEDGSIWGLRYLHHFHDPLKTWDKAGLDIDTFPYSSSSIEWSQLSTTNSLYNLWSWDWARLYYYNALVTGDEFYYANTFKSLGHLMHLVADLAVPAHVRNDSHPGIPGPPTWKKDPYEIWAASEKGFGELNFTGLSVDMSIFNNYKENSLAPVPISALWDQDKYNMPNPDPSVTKDIIPNLAEIGLAEYTNANFFSKDTMFVSYPPHPAGEDVAMPIDWSNPEMVVAEDGKTDYRPYILEDAGGTSPIRLAAAGYLTFNCMAIGHTGAPILDEMVYEDYASRLIPRAVGYSTALLDYFFRGTLEISPPAEYVYSVIDGGIVDGSLNSQIFSKIKAKVRNSTATGEEMAAGELIAVAKYKKLIGYQPDLSSGTPASDMRESQFSYSVSAEKELTQEEIDGLNLTEGHDFTFDFSANPIPAGITDLYLQVVFKGTLGNEVGAVAVGMKDLNEPQHITFWNDTDYFLLNGTPRLAEEIEYDPNVADYGYIYPYTFTEEIGFSESYPFVDAPPIISFELPPARYSRIILLSDNPIGYFLTDHVTAYKPDETVLINETFKYSLPGAIHQQAPDGTWDSTPVNEVRGVVQHQRIYQMNYYPYFLYINSLPAPPENNLGPYPATINFPNETESP